LEYACLIDDYWPGVDPLPLYRDVLKNLPNNALAHYRIGRLLLKRDQGTEAFEHLRQAMDLDMHAIESILICLRQYFLHRSADGVSDGAIDALYALCIDRIHDLQTQDRIDDEDRFIPHGLDTATLQSLTRLLAGFDKIKTAWIVRRQADGVKNPATHYFILLDWSGSVASESSGLSMLIKQIDLPGQVSVFTGTGNGKSAKEIKRAAGKPFYCRRKR
jgi:hypothetical protein